MRVGGRRLVRALAKRVRAQAADYRMDETDDGFLLFAWNDEPGRSFVDIATLIARATLRHSLPE